MKRRTPLHARPTCSNASAGDLWVFPLAFCYYESMFRVFTSGDFLQLSTLTMLLFAAGLGLLLYLPLSFLHSGRARRIAAGIVLLLSALAYLVEYFVYFQFKVFYDLNTVFGGAGGVLTGFARDICELVFCRNGVAKILLFLLPTVLFLIGHLKSRHRPAARHPRRAALAAMVLCFGAALLIVSQHPVYSAVFGKEYNFQKAVGNFGLAPGIGLDVHHMLFPSNDFEQPIITPDAPAPASEHQEQPAPEAFAARLAAVLHLTTPKEYGWNQLELNFEKPTDDQRILELNRYVQGQTASRRNQYTGLFRGKNLIMITAEAFSHKVIHPQLTPALYRLANNGIRFTEFYQPSSAGTTGGEYQNLMGMIPTAGGMSMKNTADHCNAMTMGWQLNDLGYYGMAFHNNSYTYYDRHKTHSNLGFSGGYMGYGNGIEQYVTDQWPQSDLEMVAGTLPLYIDRQPFHTYYMSVSGHCGYSRSANAMVTKNWDKVQNLPCSDTIKGYLAANLELEYALQHLLTQLEAKGIADDTVICLTADHFPYGLDQDARFGDMPCLEELYGAPVNNYFDRDRNALLLWSGCLEGAAPITVEAPVFSLDILPTLLNLFGVEFDSRLLPGRDVFSDAEPLIFNTNFDWTTACGTYFASTNEFIPRPEMKDPLPEGYVESTKAVVRNKIRYCELALETDYFRYLLGQ